AQQQPWVNDEISSITSVEQKLITLRSADKTASLSCMTCYSAKDGPKPALTKEQAWASPFMLGKSSKAGEGK
ncbi:hypothetical protein DPMN_084158, partial [Dreissena polymorpha]